MKKKILSVFMVVVVAFCSLAVPASAKTAKLSKPSITSAEVKNTSVKLTWESVDGAEKYKVYFSTSEKKNFKNYVSTSKTSATIKNLKPKKKYYFKVIAVANSLGEKIESSFSKTVSIKTEAVSDKAQAQPDSKTKTVYITPTGKKYHYDPNCNGGTYTPTTLGEALTLGLTPCKKCVH